MDTFNSIINLIKSAALLGGGIFTIWGVVVLGTSLKDHNGPGIQNGIWQIVGGLLIVAAAALFSSLVNISDGGSTPPAGSVILGVLGLLPGPR